MRKFLAVTVFVAALTLAPAALASTPTRVHLRTYRTAYATARHEFGPRAVGCNLVDHRGSCHVQPSDRIVTTSVGVLYRMLHPPRASSAGFTATRGTTQTALTVAVPSSGLAACIIRTESRGNPQAVNGQYTGIAQWSPTSWVNGGGTRYASTPLGATRSEQIAVLNDMLNHGQAGQWTPYDPC